MRFAGPAARLMAGLLMLGLGGCGLKGALGLEKNSPDEFSVPTNRPLVLPPSYDLRPPNPGEPRSQDSPAAQGKQALFGPPPAAPYGAAGQSPGETALLQRSGADQADSQIRQQVNAETAPVSERGEGFTDRVLYGSDQPSPGTPQGTGAPAPAAPATEQPGGTP